MPSLHPFQCVAPLPLLTLPSFNPLTSGPNSEVWPYLSTWLCASVLLLLLWCAVPQTNVQSARTVAEAWLLAACVSAVLGCCTI